LGGNGKRKGQKASSKDAGTLCQSSKWVTGGNCGGQHGLKDEKRKVADRYYQKRMFPNEGRRGRGRGVPIIGG